MWRMDELAVLLPVTFYNSPDACIYAACPYEIYNMRVSKFGAVVKSAARAAEMLMCFDWHPLTDTNATGSDSNVATAN